MLRSLLLVVVLSLPPARLVAKDHHWGFDTLEIVGVSRSGNVSLKDGVKRNSIVFNGRSLLKVNGSQNFTKSGVGFTVTAWVNPYVKNGEQQMLACKNQYALNQREWGLMIDKDHKFRLYLWQGKWLTIDSDVQPKLGQWHLIGAVVRPGNAEFWVNGKMAGAVELAAPIPQTAAPITFGGVDDNGRIWQTLTGAMDEVRIVERSRSAREMADLYQPVSEQHELPKPVPPYELWTGPPIPDDVTKISFAEGMKSSVIHRPSEQQHKFLHGAAIVEHKGVMYANWANSPTNENGPHETLRGKRSTDGGETWGKLEVIGPGFEGADRHSHGILFVHKGEVWTICARFGVGATGRRFRGLKAEAFVLDEQNDDWESRGIVMNNCWPYDEPVKMANGNYITGGQDKDGLPVVAISRGKDFTRWDSILIPFEAALQPAYAETTVWSDDDLVTAVIRGGRGVAWVSTSKDYGRTWSVATASNLPMPRAKAYMGKLSSGQRYLISNLKNRDTLVVSVSRPGEHTFSSMFRIRHGKSVAPRFAGRAKSSQWSYPYGYEHDGKLYVLYSIGKEECGLTVIPLQSLRARSAFGDLGGRP